MLSVIRGYSIFILGLLNLISFVIGKENLIFFLVPVTLIVLVQCLPVTGLLTRYISCSLFAAGIIIFLVYNASLSTWVQAILQNAKILTLILFVPMLGIPLQFKRYTEALEKTLKKFRTGKSGILYIITHGTSQFLGSFINVATVPVTYNIMSAGSSKKMRHMLATAAGRGCGSMVFWSPNSAAIGIVLGYWGHRALDILIYGLPFAVLAILIGWGENNLRERFYHNKEEESISMVSPDSNGEKIHKVHIKNLIQVVSAIFFMVGIVILLDTNTSLDILTIVPLSALVIPVVWSVAIDSLHSYLDGFKEYLHTTLPHMSNEVVIFLGAGFFAVAIGISPVGEYLPLLFQKIAGERTLIILLLGLFIIGFSLIGLHPVLTSTSILQAFTPESLGISFSYLAVVLIVCWGLAITCAPFSAINLSISGLIQRSYIEVAFKWQLPYVIITFLLLIVYMKFLELVVGI